jgi:uncharacterized lipoprotein YddW (UPF0748 family)
MNLSIRFALFLMLIMPLVGKSAKIRHEPDKLPGTNNQATPLKSEFRAIWIATINNIDWPSKPGLPVEEQKAEFLKLLDTIQKFNLNVVILQVRPASDAFYESETEPWSHFLTGKQGRAPKPFYDPLAWAIETCHQRGMELHAWFNPFRVRNIGYYPLDPNSFAAKHPQFVKEFDKKLFLDPGYPEVRNHVVAVIAEVAKNYDVDAILLDDYFYPYPVAGKKFGDEKSFAKYGHKYYPKKIKEWRRENINLFVSRLRDTLQSINPEIKFGISPFGIWRNKSVDPVGSGGLRGISSYDDLYADVRKWLMNGWIDFVIPQLYWEKGNHFGDFTSMVKWWSENSFGKSLYIGQALYKTTSEKHGWANPEELNDQINFLRTNEKVKGFAFYSASNMGELTSKQAKHLFDNQLNSEVAIDDNRHSIVAANAVAAIPVSAPVQMVQTREMLQQEFLSSLDNYPISIREIWNNLSAVRPTLNRIKGNRILSWKVRSDTTAQLIALVTFKNTGKGKYRQVVSDFSDTDELVISEQKWKELKEMELLLVKRDIKSKTDSYSDFFELKRRRVKTTGNPFRHK